MMYSLALMVYDAPYGGPPSSIQTPEGLRNYERSMDALWEIHRLVLNNFKFVDPTSYDRENYDQHGMYFELMRVIPGGNEVVMDIVGRLPRTTGTSCALVSLRPPTIPYLIFSPLFCLSSFSLCFPSFNLPPADEKITILTSSR